MEQQIIDLLEMWIELARDGLAPNEKEIEAAQQLLDELKNQ